MATRIMVAKRALSETIPLYSEVEEYQAMRLRQSLEATGNLKGTCLVTTITLYNNVITYYFGVGKTWHELYWN